MLNSYVKIRNIIVIIFWRSHFITYIILYAVFTFNQMSLISFRKLYHVNECLGIHGFNESRSLLYT